MPTLRNEVDALAELIELLEQVNLDSPTYGAERNNNQ